MKTILKTTFAAALSFAVVSPALAGDETIVVQSQAEMEEWYTETSRNLNDRLKLAEAQSRMNAGSGIVQLRFTLDDKGKPENIKVYNSSADFDAKYLAKRAVRSLTGLDEAPVQNAGDQVYQANIIFADSQREYEELAAELQSMERARLASASSGESAVIAIGL